MDSTSATGREEEIKFTTIIPGDILTKINKIAESERLQQLKMAAIGLSTENNQVIYLDYFLEVDYVKVKKSLLLR